MRGLIIVDGDSVPLGKRQGILEEETWAYLLGKSRGAQVYNIAAVQNTLGASSSKVLQILDLNPAWYIAQFGQWSLFRPQGKEPIESLEEFKRSGSLLAQTLLEHRIKVCFVTPLPQLYHGGFAKDVRGYIAAIRELVYAHKISLLDAHSYMSEDIIYGGWKEVDSWFDVYENEPLHYSAIGHRKVAEYFNLPEHQHIGI